MNSAVNKYQIDMCHGPLFSKIIVFVLPLMLSNIMQMLFNAVDLVVIGQYATHESMAAIGSCTMLISLLLTFFLGLSVGTNVVAAYCIGARDRVQTQHAVQTAILIALFGGIFLAAGGILFSNPMLRLMETPSDVLPKSTIYMKIYCAGIPFILLYNFGSSILRAQGDTRRPLFFMIISGIVKICINLTFVCGFRMDVAGVAAATLIANLVSAILILGVLMTARDDCRLEIKKIRFHAQSFKEILKNGIPAGIQGILFGVSNVIIQSTINTFGSRAIAGNAAASSLEGIAFVCFYTFYISIISFSGQNYGAKKYRRIIRSFLYHLLLTILVTTVIGWSFYLAGKSLLSFFNPDPGVIKWGLIRLKYLMTPYMICAAMEVINGCLRGMGHSFKPTFVALMGICVFRVFWVFCIFPHYRTMENLLISYPISWILVILVNGFILYYVFRKTFRDAVSGPRPHYSMLADQIKQKA